MKIKFSIVLAFFAMILPSCVNQNVEDKPEDNLLYTANTWIAMTDELGSSNTPENITVVDSIIEVDFILKKQVENEIVFIELVCELGFTLSKQDSVTITYKCDEDLVIKLSQSDFGKDGDKSYAHYQYIVPASEKYTTKKLKFSNFTQPDWTPEYSKGKSLILSNINAIYLTPNVDATIGGRSSLGVMRLILQ